VLSFGSIERFAITNDLRAKTRCAERVVRVSITDGLAIAFLVPALVDFKLKYPTLQLHIISPGNFQNLRESQNDLMIRFMPERDQDSTSRPLGYLQLLAITCRNYVGRHGLPTRQSVGQHIFVDRKRARGLCFEPPSLAENVPRRQSHAFAAMHNHPCTLILLRFCAIFASENRGYSRRERAGHVPARQKRHFLKGAIKER